MLNKELLLAGIPSYKITLTGGSAASDKECAMAGEVVTITTSPPAYRFTQVTINPSVNIDDLGNNKYSFVMPSSDVTVNVTYNQSQAYSIRVNSSAGGSVSSSHSSAKWGDIVTLTILPNSGWGLSSITSPDVSFSGSGNTRTFVMPNKAVTISASFYEIPPEAGYLKARITIGADTDYSYDEKNSYKGFESRYNPFGSMSPTHGYQVIRVGYRVQLDSDSGNEQGGRSYSVYTLPAAKGFYLNNKKYSNNTSGREARALFDSLTEGSVLDIWVQP